MRRGRKPKPTELKRLAGTDRPCRVNRNEPVLPPGLPPPPDDLGPLARAEWDRLVGLLVPSRVVTAGEYELLVLLSREWARLAQAEHELANGLVIVAQSGFPVQSPWLAIARASIKSIMAMLTELGLTPSSRTRVSAQPGESDRADILD